MYEDALEQQFDDFAADHFPEDADQELFSGDNWKFDTPPVQPELPFLGASGPHHSLSPQFATPFDYFCLFVPILWDKFAQYTNVKADMESEKKDNHVREWRPTCAAECKAWVASVLWWCLMKYMSFHQFYDKSIYPGRCKRWFPSFTRWEQLKRFWKVSHPRKDKDNVTDWMFRVRELFDHFMLGSKANYWPNACVALDEVMKKFKGRCLLKQYIKNKPASFSCIFIYLFLKIFVFAHPTNIQLKKKCR